MKRAMLVLLAVLALPASASAKVTQQVSQSGGVKATLSFDCKRDQFECKDFFLTINRQGTDLVAHRRIVAATDTSTVPADQPPRKSVLAVDLDRNGEPEVVVDLFTGGAHCCSYSLIYGYSAATGGYVRLRQVWGNAGYALRDIGRDGIFEFDSRDDHFAYVFASYAESRFPPQIWRYRANRLVDVTRRFPSRVRKDARDVLRSLPRYRRQKLDLRGFMAAYQADNYLLGRREAASGWRRLRAMARRGELRRPRGGVGPAGTGYLKALRRFLVRQGYTH
jgi:hypothetical protein